MKCFVIAMESEAKIVLDEMVILSDEKIHGKRVVTGTLFGEQTAVIICGVGKVNAACGTQYLIDLYGADEIINIGFAGGLGDKLKIGGVYGIYAAVQYDFDLVQLNGGEIGTLDECDKNYLEIVPPYNFVPKKLATGDRFNDSAEDHALLTGVLHADIRDMEGAAIAQVCMHAGVKCRIYKAVSDIYGSGSTTEQFKNNIALCANALSAEIKNIWTDNV